jgi:hypothetical protein
VDTHRWIIVGLVIAFLLVVLADYIRKAGKSS